MFLTDDKNKLAQFGILESDLQEIPIPSKELLRQITLLREGIPFIKIQKPCTIGDGIKVIPIEKHSYYLKLFEEAGTKCKMLKFVPASGAATRMFKILNFIFKNYSNEEICELKDSINLDKEFSDFFKFFKNIEKFAFFEDLQNVLKDNGYNYFELLKIKDYFLILDYLLSEKGLNYSNFPKALIKFHKYDGYSLTPFQEHLKESAEYTLYQNNLANLHITISELFFENFNKNIDDLKNYIKNENIRFNVEFSYQNNETNTICIDFNNNILRNENGKLIERPGGHGSLLSNLNELDADMIFIKNIDNVVSDKYKDSTILYKKLLGGLFYEIQTKIFDFLKKIENKDYNDLLICEITDFIKIELNRTLAENFNSMIIQEKADIVFQILNRPLRVCGMVKNESEVGGGPFIIQNNNLEKSNLQILESAQIDLNSVEQKKIFESSTHFNPVDLVCGIKDYKGNKFNLKDFVDYDTFFINKKSVNGIDAKVLEYPGLWNGSMAYWNTVFVEVPISTFNPVKSVLDLLRDSHTLT